SRSTKVGTPASAARCRPPALWRSDPTATTRAPYDGSAHASSSACRLVPVPEIRATRRAVTQEPYPSATGSDPSAAGVGRRGGGPVPRGAVIPAATVPSSVPGVTRAVPNAATSHGTGPVVASWPAPSGPPEAAAATPSSAPATSPAASAATSRAGHRTRPSRVRRADHHPAANPATVGTSSRAAPSDGSGPAGSPAKTGRAGSGPSATSLLRTTLSVPTANPGPSR